MKGDLLAVVLSLTVSNFLLFSQFLLEYFAVYGCINVILWFFPIVHLILNICSRKAIESGRLPGDLHCCVNQFMIYTSAVLINLSFTLMFSLEGNWVWAIARRFTAWFTLQIPEWNTHQRKYQIGIGNPQMVKDQRSGALWIHLLLLQECRIYLIL